MTGTVYYSDDAVTLHHGHSLDVLRGMPHGTVNCCVTSPPYFGLRSYLPADHPDKAKEYGAEKTPAEYVANMRDLFAEVRRVLADDGTLWLNLGDSYSTGTGNRNDGLNERWGNASGARKQEHDNQGRAAVAGMPAKNLLGIPWRTAFALQDDGWILRNCIVWSKVNAMPESVTDRLSTRHEFLFLFSKRPRYWFDLDPIREEPAASSVARSGRGRSPDLERQRGFPGSAQTMDITQTLHERGSNPGDVWTVPTQPFPGAHFAVFPVEIPRRCIASGCRPRVCSICRHGPDPIYEDPSAPKSELVQVGWTDCGHGAYEPGTVLDPFSGSGTTGLAAGQLGRKYVGIDLSTKYLDLSLNTRLAQTALLDGGAA
jgi:DNA modification methylase